MLYYVCLKDQILLDFYRFRSERNFERSNHIAAQKQD